MARRSTTESASCQPTAGEVHPRGVDALRTRANISAERSVPYTISILGAGMMSAGATGEFLQRASGNFASFTYGVATSAAVGVCALANYIAHRRRHREVLEQATAFEADFGHSVDLVLLPGGIRQSPTPALRWYGLDDSSSLSPTAEQAARRVANKATEMEIDTVAIGTSWLAQHEVGDDTPSLERYGRVIDGKTALSQLNGMAKHYKMADNDAGIDDKVLVTTPAKLLELMDEYSVSDLARLAALLPGDTRLQELVAIAQQTHDYTDLRRHVSVALERELDDGAMLYTERDGMGVVHRHKAHSTVRLVGDTIYRQSTVHDGSSHRLMPGDTSELLRELGVASADELLDGSEEPARSRVLAALHIALHEAAELHLSGTSSQAANDTGPDSLFARMQAGKNNYKLEWTQRVTIGRSAIAICLVGAAGAAAFSGLEEAKAILHDNAAPRMAAYKAAYEQHHKQTGLDIERGGRDRDDFLRFLEAQYGDGAVLEKLMSDAYLDIKEADARYGQWLSGLLNELTGKGSIPGLTDPPPSMYTTSRDNMFIGDVKRDSDQTVYTVTPLTPEARTGGYWVGSTYNAVEVTRGNSRYPFKDGRVELGVGGMTSPAQLIQYMPANLADIANYTPNYRVETPYISPGRSISLPVKAGSYVVGVRIIDASDPSWSSGPVSIWKIPDSGVYEARLTAKDFVSQGIPAKQPRLEYYVKESVAASRYSIDSPIAMLSVGDSHVTQLWPESVAQVAAATRRALGLGETATAEEIFAAISQRKKYSFTPFERADFGGVDLSNMSDTQALEMVGQTLAELDTLNCNLATMLATLATADQEIGVRPATGFLDNGDGKLMQSESHAFFWSAEHGIRDATPGALADGEPVPGLPSAGRGDMGPVLPITGAGLVAAALAVVAYRRRHAIGEGVDTLRATVATRLPAADGAVDLLVQAAYSQPEAPLQLRAAPSSDSRQELLRRYAANIPRGGISLDEIRERARMSGQKLPWAEQLAMAAMKANDGPLRRTHQRTQTDTEKQP